MKGPSVFTIVVARIHRQADHANGHDWTCECVACLECRAALALTEPRAYEAIVRFPLEDQRRRA